MPDLLCEHDKFGEVWVGVADLGLTKDGWVSEFHPRHNEIAPFTSILTIEAASDAINTRQLRWTADLMALSARGLRPIDGPVQAEGLVMREVKA